MKNIKINILGSKWTIKEMNSEQDKTLLDADGYTDWTIKTIVIRREIDGNLADMEAYIKKVTRHEIVHAFLFESGLAECSGTESAWALNEAMVDWIARQGPKIYEAWKQADAI